MSVTLSLTESQIFQALGNFLVTILPVGTAIVRAQDNRVAEPSDPDFVTMNSILRERLSTNVTTYADAYPVSSTRSDLDPMKVTIQLDVHGPNSADNAQIIATMLRSDVAVDQFATSGFDVQPLYASDPKQIPFTNGEQQIEDRWIVEAMLQGNPVVTSPQDFFTQAVIGVEEVDTTFPP